MTRMPDDRLAKQLLHGELCYGKRSVGGQKKRSKDTLMKTLTNSNIDVTNWEVCAHDRPLWRSMIHTTARRAETSTIAEARKKRAARKASLYSTTRTSAEPTYPCPECGRVLQARIGLISHLRTHKVNQTPGCAAARSSSRSSLIPSFEDCAFQFTSVSRKCRRLRLYVVPCAVGMLYDLGMLALFVTLARSHVFRIGSITRTVCCGDRGASSFAVRSWYDLYTF